MRSWVCSLACLFASGLSLAAGSDVERVFRDACLSSYIAEKHLPIWATAHAKELSPDKLPRAVTDVASRAWQVAGATGPVYVLLTKKWGCAVWAEAGDPAPIVQRFREWAQAEARDNKDPNVRITSFKDGEIVPGHLAAVCYVVTFGTDRIGLMWSARVSNTGGTAYVSLEASRVRVKP